jgi:hypothetical protein
MGLEQMISNGLAKLDAEADLARKKQDKEDADRERARQISIHQFVLDASITTPLVLVSYLVLGDSSDNWEPGYTEHPIIRVPGCNDIKFEMTRFYEPDKTGQRKSDYIWRPNNNLGYFIESPQDIYMDYELDRWVVRHETIQSNDIEIALAYAFQAFNAEQEWAVEAEKRNAKLDADLHTQAEKKTAGQERAADQAAVEDRRRQHLLSQVMMDPVAFRLLQTFSEIMQERAAWHDQLSNANDCVADLEESYGARLSRAEQAARDAQREAENARTEAVTAGEEADRVQRKLNQLERER